jgi:hypothetical protein
MNSRQRRKLRRWAEREMERMRAGGFGRVDPTPKPMPWKLVLIMRASRKHFDALCVRNCWPGGRTEGHLFEVLDDHRDELLGARHRPHRDYYRRDPNFARLRGRDEHMAREAS